MRGRVVVAMSGGVDSSVTAAILKAQGWEVIGMMMRLWSEPGKEGSNRCCTPDAMALARRVAAQLDIPFYAVDAQAPFREIVVQYFIDGYAQGLTPNPCLACNRLIRWEFLLERALALGATHMATGHYVRLACNFQGRFVLRKAVDQQKDQSYILHVLNQQQLAHALFPLGDYTKPVVRHLARQFGLPVASRADSQDLCFLAGDDYRHFLQRHAPHLTTAGPIVDLAGKQLGEHHGLPFYTIGQRKGIGISSSAPLYVIEKDTPNNTLVVGSRQALGTSEFLTSGINWVGDIPPERRLPVEVKTRYTARPLDAWIELINDHQARVRLQTAAPDITPGQAAVFYRGDVLLGGGLIQSNHTDHI